METVIGLNVNHNDTCLFTRSAGSEGLREFNQFVHETLNDATRLVALRLEDRKLPRHPVSWNGANFIRGISICDDEFLFSYF